jgi:hypothetical protein
MVMSGSEKGLRLTLGGAPNTWHTLGEHPGLYHPQIPTLLRLVGRDEEWASSLHDDDGCPVSLVDVAAKDASRFEEAFLEACGERDSAAVRATARPASGAELDRIKSEAAQAAGAGE